MKPLKIIIFITVFVLSFTAIFFIIKIYLKKDYCYDSTYSEKIILKDHEICVEIVNTPDKMQKGLSGRESLCDKCGMLFDFPQKTNANFWMKEMLIPLDMIWISDERVVDITKDVPISTTISSGNLPIYSPKEKVNIVLEVNAGFTDKYNIEIADTLTR